ncbi:hypothetical protein DFH09DRAFT_1164665, partial [Mycena vulgaris]
MDQDHIQIPQELVNHVIDFLHDTPTDLKACALVSRAFVHAAQSHIFNELSIGHYGATTSEIDALWSRCQATLHASPHLVQHIHQFKPPRQMSIDTLSAICNFPFTHLKEVCIHDLDLSRPFVIALQQLFSLPSLRFVSLECCYVDPSTFMQIWDRCAPGLKHLELRCCQTSTEAFHPTSHRWPTPIRVDSLRITIIDLSSFLSLVFFRISVEGAYAWTMALKTLSTIAPSNHIRKIVISGVFTDGITAEELDARLSSLPMHHSPVFHFEMDPAEYDRLAPTLHRLSSTNM